MPAPFQSFLTRSGVQFRGARHVVTVRLMRFALCFVLVSCGAVPTLADGGEGNRKATMRGELPNDPWVTSTDEDCDGGRNLLLGARALAAKRLRLTYFFAEAPGTTSVCTADVWASEERARAIAGGAAALGCSVGRMPHEHGQPDITTLDCLALCDDGDNCITFPDGAKANACEWNP